MASISNLKDQAKVWEQAERWQDMALCMKEMVEIVHAEHEIGKLASEERYMLSVAYKNMVGSRRSALRIIASVEQKEADGSETRQAAKWLREKVETEMKEMCDEVLELLDKFLIPSVHNADSEVFYQKMKGDYLRYLAEITDGKEKEDIVKKAEESYKKAHETAVAYMPPVNPIRLEVALNFSLFHYQTTRYGITPQKQDAYKDSTLIMELLQGNATRWASEN
uniref:14-3-3 domain-containing protein n=1 Tax=Branchiostoma floridae TaxID=7739 RepID=C3ZEH5_BRAFL|eukprot:XP_002593120.1 hypothetical protein BRAFLDRAFT_114088 [Branchiostoma floridae]